MEAFAIHLAEIIISGGSMATLAILVLIIIYLLLERSRLLIELKEVRALHDKNILDIIDKYHKGQISLIEAFNDLKTILMILKER